MSELYFSRFLVSKLLKAMLKFRQIQLLHNILKSYAIKAGGRKGARGKQGREGGGTIAQHTDNKHRTKTEYHRSGNGCLPGRA